MSNKDSIDATESIVQLLPNMIANIKKPVIGVVDGGKLYDPMVESMEKKGVLVFRSSDRAVTSLAKYINCRIHTEGIISRG